MIEIIGGMWAANETKTFTINGEYLEILEAQYPVDVMLMDKTGAQLSIMRSSEASFFSRPKEGFQTVQIASVQAQAIRVFVGSGDAGTRRISSTVQVVDGERARANAGVMFAGSGTVTAIAAQFPAVQLWNPAASGKRLVVSALSFSSTVSQPINVWSSTVAEATNLSATNIGNKLLSSGLGAAELRIGSKGAIPGQSMFGIVPAALSINAWKPSGVIVVPPGFGLLTFGASAASNLSVNFEWFEEVV